MERKVNNHRKSVKKKIAILNKNLKKENSMDNYRKKGDLLAANINKIEKGMDSISLNSFYDNKLVKILVAPGLWMQRITTQEPDDTMLEVALVSLQAAMPDIFPDFIPPTNANKDENINTQNNM